MSQELKKKENEVEKLKADITRVQGQADKIAKVLGNLLMLLQRMLSIYLSHPFPSFSLTH